MTSSKISHYLETYCPDLDSSMPVHPTFLYESLCTTAIFLVLLLAVRPNSERRFETASVYMVLYGIARFFIEGLRTDSLYLGSSNIRTSQLLSLILVFGGLTLILVSHLKEWEIIPLPENAFARREEKNKSKK
jgi:phosphatidylglycerol:prolipoprotein diacylglycerol transferase